MDYKIILVIIAASIAALSYVPYIKSMIKGITKPHAFSWLIWSVIASITFAAQITSGAGAGALVSAWNTILCLFIFVFALKNGEKNIAFLDWLSLGGAVISLFFWYLTSSPLITVIIITIIDCIAFIPTLRKSYHAPAEENASLFIISSMSYVIALFAMATHSVITVLNPFVLIIANCSFSLFLFWRRNRIIKD